MFRRESASLRACVIFPRESTRCRRRRDALWVNLLLLCGCKFNWFSSICKLPACFHSRQSDRGTYPRTHPRGAPEDARCFTTVFYNISESPITIVRLMHATGFNLRLSHRYGTQHQLCSRGQWGFCLKCHTNNENVLQCSCSHSQRPFSADSVCTSVVRLPCIKPGLHACNARAGEHRSVPNARRCWRGCRRPFRWELADAGWGDAGQGGRQPSFCGGLLGGVARCRWPHSPMCRAHSVRKRQNNKLHRLFVAG